MCKYLYFMCFLGTTVAIHLPRRRCTPVWRWAGAAPVAPSRTPVLSGTRCTSWCPKTWSCWPCVSWTCNTSRSSWPTAAVSSRRLSANTWQQKSVIITSRNVVYFCPSRALPGEEDGSGTVVCTGMSPEKGFVRTRVVKKRNVFCFCMRWKWSGKLTNGATRTSRTRRVFRRVRDQTKLIPRWTREAKTKMDRQSQVFAVFREYDRTCAVRIPRTQERNKNKHVRLIYTSWSQEHKHESHSREYANSYIHANRCSSKMYLLT